MASPTGYGLPAFAAWARPESAEGNLGAPRRPPDCLAFDQAAQRF